MAITWTQKDVEIVTYEQPHKLSPAKSEVFRKMILRFMGHGDVFEIVHAYVAEGMTTNRMIQDYVRTKGATDWVWLEESLSAASSEALESELSRAGSAFAREVMSAALYFALFALSLAVINAVYPQVRPPTWFEPIRAFIQDRKHVATTEAEIIRDMLLEGRDDEALAILELGGGARLYWNADFWTQLEAASSRARSDLPPTLSYTVVGSFDSMDGFGAYESVGIAISMFAEDARTSSYVKISLNADAPPSKWDDVIVFAIAATDAEIQRLVPNARPV